MPAWRLGFNDDTPIGWVITVAYFVATGLALRASRTDARPRFWVTMAALLALLGLNKQLDLQTPFLHLGRVGLDAIGLGAARTLFRAMLLILLLAAGAIGVLAAVRMLRGAWSQYWLPLLGLAGLAAFVLLRAATFNHVGLHVARRLFFSQKLAAGLELGSIVMIAAGAVWKRRAAR